MTKLLIVFIPFLLTGCMAMIFGTADQLNKVSIGMPKEEVLKLLGSPKSVSADSGVEYLQYSWVKTVIAADGNFPENYYVAIRNGKVSDFGKKGDFDSAKLPAQRIEIDQSIRQNSTINRNSKEDKDLYKELTKLKDLKDSGTITETEFNTLKKKLLAEQ